MKTKHLYTAAGLCVVLICLSFFAVHFYQQKAQSTLGPKLVAMDNNNGQVAMTLGENLYLFDKSGRVLARQQLSNLFLPITISSMQLTNNTLYFADSGEGSLYECDLLDWVCGTVPGFSQISEGAFQFEVYQNQVFITDALQHSLKIYDMQGNLAANNRSEPTPLCGPQQVSHIDGDLYIADTFNHRIAKVDVKRFNGFPSESALKVGNSQFWENVFPARASADWCEPHTSPAQITSDSLLPQSPAKIRNGFVWPTAFAKDQAGYWWVALKNQNQDKTDVAIFNNGEVIRKLETANDIDVSGIYQHGSTMLIADRKSLAIHKFSDTGKRLGIFGDAQFMHEIGELREAKQKYEFFENLALALMMILAVAAVFTLHCCRKAKTNEQGLLEFQTR